MKRKFSLLVTIVFCLLLVAGILSACNDTVEEVKSVAGSYFMKDDSSGWWELGLDGQWLNSMGERGTYGFTAGEGDELNGDISFYDAVGTVIYTGKVQGIELEIKGDAEVLWDLEKNPNTVNFQAVYAYAEDLGYTGSLEDLVKLFKGDSAYGLAKKYGYTGTEKDWLDSLRGEKGDSGKSAYDLVVELGYKGTLGDWLASLTGDKGDKGDKGDSAYDVACGLGFVGTIQDWLNSLGGNGIEKIEKTSSEGNVDTYTIYYTKGGTTTFTVTNGKSAYELAVENGYQGTLEEWLASLVGETGANGEDGKSAYELAVENGYEGTLDDWLESLVGATGAPGATGEAGADGKSAYELAVENGFEGSLEEWLTSLVGSAGADGADGSDGADGVGIEKIEKTGSDGNVDTYTIYFTNGETTTFTVTNGKSAYELAVENGYQGTVEEWLASLVGETGANGEDGKSAYELAVENGYEGTLDDWLESLVGATGAPGATGEAGADGKSAYELAVENGFEGSLEEWLTSLVGSAGADGADGSDGADGVGIDRIEKTGSDGNVDTYTIYFTDGETTTLTVTNATPAVPVTVTFEARGGVIEGYDYLDLTFVGGEYDAYTATILSGNAIEQLPIPVRSGLQFCGWFTGTTINDGQWLNNNTVSVDFTLYARWTSHPFVHYERVEPDCTNDGNIEYWYCPDCDKYFSDPGCTIVIDEGDIILPAAGHMMTEHPFKAATCTEDGNIAYWYCNVCEKYFSDAEGANSIRENQIGIPAAGHSYTETVVDPTCITEGYTLHTCSACGYSYRDNEVPKLGHNFVDGVCTVCGEQFYSDGLEFTLSGDESYYIVTDVGTATGDIVIPDAFNGLPVREIGEYAFYGCTDITSISISAGVTSIGYYAFYGCSSLNTVYYAGSIENWFNIEFENSSSNPLYNGADLYIDGELVTEVVVPESITIIIDQLSGCTSLTSIIIHSGVISIGYAFSDCSSLASVTFAEGSRLTDIGSSAFNGCSSLTSIEIPAGVTSIRFSAFSGCSSLTSIEIPAGVTSIGDRAYEYCSNLTGVTFGEGSQLTSIGEDAFRDCSSLKSIEIPAGVTSIGSHAFEDCNNLESVTFADGSQLTSIGYSAFYACSSLTSIEIPAGVTSIGDRAFEDCSNLESVSFAEGSQLTSIGDYAFIRCSSLQSIEIPAGVTSIGGSAFNGCSNLESVTFAEGSQLTDIGEGAFRDCSSLKSIDIPAGVTSIGDQAFLECRDLESVTFAEGSQLTSIGEDAFSGCNSLTAIEIPAGVTSIGGSAFEDCSSLTSIEIPAGVISIGSYAFNGCSSLTSIEIPAGVTSIGGSAFSGYYLTIVYNYSDLEITAGSSDFGYVAYYAEVVLTEDNLANVKDENGYVTYTNGEEVLLLGYLGSEKDIVIPEGVTRIVQYAFFKDDIVSVTLPESLTAIGNSAFSGCYNLKEVYNNSSLDITAGSNLYGNVAYHAAKVYTPEDQKAAFDENGFAIDGGVLRGYNGSETAVIIPDTVTSIADYAFYGNADIISVTIPAGVTSIGNYAFYGCSNLTDVSFAEGSQLTNIGEMAFRGCSSLTSIEIPAGVSELPDGGYESGVFSGCSNLESVTFAEGSQLTSIGSSAFYGCSSLTSIEIPAGVTSIEDSAFYGCNNLEEVTFAEGSQLTSIGDYAFIRCSSLQSIEIPAGVTSIGGSLFYGCSNLESVTFAEGSQLASIGWNVFYGCSSLTTIEIPAGVTSIGSEAFRYCSNLESVTFAKESQLTSIGRDAFRDCISLKSIEIPAGVTSIRGYAFSGCSNLDTVYYAGSIDNWFDMQFDYDSNPLSNGADLYIDGELVTEVVVPASIITIGDYQLRGFTSLTSITIHSGVTSIGGSAFWYCSNLESVTFAEGSQLASIGWNAFSGCSSLTSIELPAGVTSIGSSAFSGTSAKNVYITDTEAWCNIEFGDDDSNPLYYGGVLWLNGEIVFELNIPGTVERIGNYAFYNAERVKQVVIEEGVTEIGDYAFYSMYRLESVTIPSTVTKIGSYAFAHSSSPDSKLKYIYYNGTEKDWLSVEKGSNWDYNCGDYEIIFRPELAEYEVAGEVIESDATENDADNAMIEGASIVLEGENGVFEAVSGADGAFGFEDVPEGEYTLTVSKEGYITVIKEVFVDSNMFYRIVIDLDAVNTLTGKVSVADDDNDFGNNAPLEGATVTITRLSSTNAFTYTALTDADGEYSFNGLTVGRYMITVSKEGYRTVTQQFNVYMYQNNIRNIVLEAIPGTNITDGNAAGKIIDSVTGYGVGGLTLDIYKGVNITSGTIIATLTSGENGRYVTPDLEPGNYTIAIRDNRRLSDENLRYNDGSIVIKILSDKLIDNQNGYVTNNRQLDVESIRIVLTWGVYPRDLDSHLDIDLADGTHAHTYYSDKTYYRDGQLMADLDLDDTTSYGPETTTVYVMEEGVYTFYVHDYTNRTSSNSTSLANSGAKVEVYLGNSSVAAYVAYVPDDPGTLWTVFSYDSVTGIITPINGVTYHSSPSSIGQ